MNEPIISSWDWLLGTLYIMAILFCASLIKKRQIKRDPIYKYFLWGLIAKITGAIGLCLIYVYYYSEGGDTLSYHYSARCFVNLLFQSPSDFFNVWLSSPSSENFYFFNADTGFPPFYIQQYEFFMVRLMVPLELIAFKSYLVASVLMAVVSFTGVWKLYRLFCELYPVLSKYFAFAVLFVPSVVFWGSGILKDSWTLAACGWYCYSFHRVFIKRKNIMANITSLVIASILLVAIKPYIFIAILPGSLIWGSWAWITGIRNFWLKILVVPFAIIFTILIGILIWNFSSSRLGSYSSLDAIVIKAHVSYLDLQKDYYQGNSFDMGDYDPTLTGLLSKFPIASFTGLFRPFIWESQNVVMLFSGSENLFVLFFFFYVFLKSPFSNIKNLFSKPIVLFSLIFAVFFSFSVAISTSNFGALVRLRIPEIPFFISALIILNFTGRKEQRDPSA